MARAEAAIDINKDADSVWAVVGDFGGLAEWSPGIESCRVEGDIRILAMMGMEITERLVDKDDSGRVLSYSITDGVPVENHLGVITVTAKGNGSHVTWEVTATPDEMASVMVGIYQQALEALRTHVEG